MKHQSAIGVFVLAGFLFTSLTAQEAAPSVSKKVEVGKNVFLEVDKAKDERRVWIEAEVCLRQGMLEQLLTRARTKEHEAVLAADVDASVVHTALTLARAEAGSPVKYRPKFEPPKGTVIRVTLQWKNKDKIERVDAKEWVRNFKTKKTLGVDWVFAGSQLYKDPLEPDKKPYYAANDGDLICLSNFDTALLDVPFESTKDNDELYFEANTDKIPPLKTKVWVILEPVLKKGANN
jgi:hypothetical protein